jgi:hypothetical protein
VPAGANRPSGGVCTHRAPLAADTTAGAHPVLDLLSSAARGRRLEADGVLSTPFRQRVRPPGGGMR